MKGQLGDKNSSFDYYLKDAEYKTPTGSIAGGPALQGTLQPVIRLAIDSGILSNEFEDVADGTNTSYDRLTEAVQALKNKGINKPAELINAVENGVLPEQSAEEGGVVRENSSEDQAIEQGNDHQQAPDSPIGTEPE
jgi:hypothetical protein